MKKHRVFRRLLAVVFVAVLVALAAPNAAAAQGVKSSGSSNWTGAWGAAMQEAVPTFPPNWALDGFSNQSVRQIIRVTAGGMALRLQLSNMYGANPLTLTGATIAKAGAGGAIQKRSIRALTFNRSFGVNMPVGAVIQSDPVFFITAPLDRLAVTLYFASATGPVTNHNFAFATSYRATGDHLFDPSSAAFSETSGSYYFLSRVEVFDPLPTKRDVVVAFGDSITDGLFSTPNSYNTYPDQLAERLVADGRPLAVVNAGISGNRLRRDSQCFGESALHRFERDVLDQPRVRTVIVMEALNDIFDISGVLFGECNRPNPGLTVDQMIEGHRALIQAAHARGVRIVGGTVTPFKGNPYGVFTEQGEAIRDELNKWILTSGEYDAVVDFASIVADPTDSDRLNPLYDGTSALRDAIHPNDIGFAAMVAAIDLNTL